MLPNPIRDALGLLPGTKADISPYGAGALPHPDTGPLPDPGGGDGATNPGANDGGIGPPTLFPEQASYAAS